MSLHLVLEKDDACTLYKAVTMSLYAKNLETAHSTICADTIQTSVNLHTTIPESCVPG